MTSWASGVVDELNKPLKPVKKVALSGKYRQNANENTEMIREVTSERVERANGTVTCSTCGEEFGTNNAALRHF